MPKIDLEDQPLITGQPTYDSITKEVDRLIFDQRLHKKNWLLIFLVGYLFVNVLLISVGWLFQTGIGVLGNNIPAAWGVPIVSFVWWIGIGHAGTFISTFLLLMRQKWRNSINRYAEAMTIVAVLCAGMFPIYHLGRPWLAYWLIPYPNTLSIFPQFRSPLVWDIFAVMTYLTVSVLFWYVGLVPDLATMRDKAKSPVIARIYGVFSLGWRGTADHWHRYEQIYLILAGLTTALVVSVHSIVGLDFAVAQLPGWHSTFTPPFFVAGAIYSGFAMLLLLLLPIRSWYGLKDLITLKHIDWMAKMLLLTGLIVVYCYAIEMFMAFYSQTPYELSLAEDRLHGTHAPVYWTLITLNGVIPQLMWSPKMRRTMPVVFICALSAMVGMWIERLVIVPLSLTRGHLPTMWWSYGLSFWDYALLFGTVGFFLMMLFLFIRFVPAISIFESRELAHEIYGKKADVPGPPTTVEVESDGELLGYAISFADSADLIEATREVRNRGYKKFETYTPFPVKGLAEAAGIRDQRMPWIILLCAIAGGACGYLLQVYISIIHYPMNAGGRPFNSWPAFVPVTYELTILFGALGGVFGMLALNGLPQLYHPSRIAPGIQRATDDRFFLFVDSGDPLFSEASTGNLLHDLGGLVREVRT